MKIIEDIATTPTPDTFVLKADMQPTVTVTSSGICLPTTYKEVRVRTKDGTIVRRKASYVIYTDIYIKGKFYLSSIRSIREVW